MNAAGTPPSGGSRSPATAARGADTPPAVQLGIGEVRHARLHPVVHAFRYPGYFLLLPMRHLRTAPCPLLHRNGRGAISFHDADHGDGRADSLAWLDEQLAAAGLRADGEVWLQCLPRVLGHTFKPVSFWHCHGADGALVAIVAEVNNTFGGRHCYLLADPPPRNGRLLQATKALHVSPFNTVAGGYRFRFLRTPAMSARDGGRTVTRVDHHGADGRLLLRTSWSGRLAPLTAGRLAAAWLRMPCMTLAVVARIHWQALCLWAKGVPFLGRAPPVAADRPSTAETA